MTNESSLEVMQASASLFMMRSLASSVHAIDADGEVVRCCEDFVAEVEREALVSRVRRLPPPFQRVLDVESRDGHTRVTLERFIGLHGGEVISRMREVDRLLPLTVWGSIARAWLAIDSVQRDGVPSPENLGFDLNGRLVLSADTLNFAAGYLIRDDYRMVSGRPLLKRTLSPEYMRGLALEEASRVYSIGLSLIRLLTAEPVFSDETLEMLQQIMHGRVSWTPTRHPHVTSELTGVLSRAIALRPADRFPTLAAFHVALDPLLPPSGPIVEGVAGLCEPGFRAVVNGLLQAPEFLPEAWRTGGLRVMEDRLLERAVPVDDLPRPTCAPAPPRPPLVGLPGRQSSPG